ncbi:MAG TPA: transcriptional regulator [Rhizomicrobium sp.]|jgi:HTH-type transcriptional regulator/antitoxin HigA|nr:transcriptional regulator [Rhizomicrobium sp.]
MAKMDIRPLRSEKDYNWALKQIEQYFDDQPKRGTPAADRFDVLAALIEAYEAAHWPVMPPDPVDAIRLRMEQTGYKQADFGKLIGSRSRASEIMNRKRALTMEQAYKLHAEWQIPAEVLLKPSSS